jgi:hypothetical protein
MASRTLPGSVKVLGILHCVFGALGSIMGLATIALLAATATQPGSVSALTYWVNYLAPIVGCIDIGIGVGLLTRQSWSRQAALYFAYAKLPYAMMFSLAALLSGAPAGASAAFQGGYSIGAIFGGFVRMIFPGLTAFFMSQPEVKAALD